MKKILSVFSVLAFAAGVSTAMAGSMDNNNATLVSPSSEFVTNVSEIAVAWNWDPATWSGTPIEIANAPAPVTLECEYGTFTFSNLANGIPKVQDWAPSQLSFYLWDVPGLEEVYNNIKGEIKVTYPAGIVQSTTDYEPNEELTFTINVMEYMNGYTSLTPEQGTYTTDELKDAKITLTYGEYTNLEIVESAGDIRVTLQDPVTYETDEYTIPLSDVTVNGNVVSFNLIGEVPDNTDVIVTLPYNWLIGDGIAVGGSTNFRYRAWNGLPSATVISKPQGVVDKSQVPTLELTWDYQTIVPGENGIYLTFYGTETVSWTQIREDVYPEYWFESVNGGTNNVLVFDLTSIIADLPPVSYYYFLLPEAIVQNEKGQINAGAEGQYDYICLFNAVEPFDGPNAKYIFQEDNIIFYYDYAAAPEVWEGSFSLNSGATQPYIINQNGEREPQYLSQDIFTVNGEFGYYYYFNLDREFPDGATALVIPFGNFYVKTVDVQGYMHDAYLGELIVPLDIESGVEVILDANAPIEYYNIQGQRVLNPQKGQLVIKRQGNNVQKIIIR